MTIRAPETAAIAMRIGTLIDNLERAAARRPAIDDGGRLTRTLKALRADYPAKRSAVRSDTDPTTRLAAVFRLSDLDCALLWSAVAPDIDANVGIAYGLLTGGEGVSRPSVGLALELCGVPTASGAGRTMLAAQGPLLRHGLLEIPGSESWLARRLRVPDLVAAALTGVVQADPILTPLVIEPVPLELPGAPQIARALEAGEHLVWVRSVQGAAGVSLAAGAAAALGVGVLAIDLRLRGGEQSMRDVLAAAVRDAGLRSRALLVAGAEPLADAADPALLALLEAAPIPVLVVAARPWNPGWLARLPLLVEAERLDPALRERMWDTALGPIATEDPELRQTLLGLRMTPESVVTASRYARVLAAARGEPVSATIVREAARRTSGPGGGYGDGLVAAPGADTGPEFADLLLPASAAESLQQLVSWARHRDEVTAHGLLQHSGQGIAALFTGNPGTGKTLAANIIAKELSIDLFQVDLSTIVDKYIGETEKNLEKVFQTAETLDVVLFFDEADALFGSRSEVHDARDRYANQEIAYLLQRMEKFDGITILATNLRGNLDRAFSRRMSFIINFPDPDAGLRRRLWEHHFDQLDAMDDDDPIQLDFLSQVAELTGGDIRNVVRAAAYNAVSSGESVGMRHITQATLSEYRKLGRVLPEHGFRGPAATRKR